MLLTIDIGNTNLTLGVYKGDTLGPRWRLATIHDRMPDEYGMQILGLLNHAGIEPGELTGICIASVVPPATGQVAQACHQYLEKDPLIVDAGVKTGVRIRYEDPRAVGADRIVDAAAVQTLYGGPACVVDFEGLSSSDMYPISSKINRDYLHKWMITSLFTYFASQNQGRTVLPKINQKALYKLPVPVPPADEQKEIVRRVVFSQGLNDGLLFLQFEETGVLFTRQSNVD